MTDEQAKDPRTTRRPARPAPEPSEAAEPAESTLPADGSAAPDGSSAPLVSAQAPSGESEVQSKFDRRASSLGIRPPAEQSKAAPPPSDLGLRPQPPAAVEMPAVEMPAAPVLPTRPLVPIAATTPLPPAATPAATPDEDEDDVEALEPVPTWAERFRRLSPALVILGMGSLGALGFLVVAMTSHTTPVAVLLSAGVVVTLAFVADAVIASVATWRAAVWDEDPGRALLLAVIAGGSAIVCAGALGATIVLVLVLVGR